MTEQMDYCFGKLRYLNLKGILSSALVISFSYMIYTYFKKNKAKLYYVNNEKNNDIINRCPSIKSRTYQPPFLFQTNPMQLLSLHLFVSLSKNLTFISEKVKDPDNKIEGISLSWPQDLSKRQIKHKDVLVFILPGLTGGEKDTYIHQLINHIFDKGYIPVVYNYRLLSQDLSFKNTQDFINLISDLRLTFEYLKSSHPEFKHLTAIGHSYGANQIVNYLGKFNSDPIVKAAVSISNPYCMTTSSKFIEGTIYDKFLANLLGRKLNQVKNSFVDAPKEWNINLEKAINSQTLQEFDKNITIHFYGYPTVGSYYRQFGCINQILNVKVPLLCLSAKDDTIAHEKALPREESSINSNLILMETDRGSHVVWLQGNNPFNMKCWFPKPSLEFIDCIVNDIKK